MNIPNPAFGFAQARVQARLGMSPGQAFWEGLTRISDFDLTLRKIAGVPIWHELARTLAADPQVHPMERNLRGFFQSLATDVARWVPTDWCECVAHVGTVVHLPLRAHLARGRQPPAWLADDLLSARFAAGEPSTEATREAWFKGLLRSLPPGGEDTRGELTELHGELRRTVEASIAETSRGIRRRLRRNPGRPIAVFAFLALTWLDLWRLRGVLLDRLLFHGAVRP